MGCIRPVSKLINEPLISLIYLFCKVLMTVKYI